MILCYVIIMRLLWFIRFSCSNKIGGRVNHRTRSYEIITNKIPPVLLRIDIMS